MEVVLDKSPLCVVPWGVDKFFSITVDVFTAGLAFSLVLHTRVSSSSYGSALLLQELKGIMSAKCCATLLSKLIIF